MGKLRDLTVERILSCSRKGCGGPFVLYSPDDEYVIASIKPPKEGEDHITRTGLCIVCHQETPIYWH